VPVDSGLISTMRWWIFRIC